MNDKKIIDKMITNKLRYEEIEYIVNKYVNNKLSDKTMSKFIMNIYNNGLSDEELLYLTDVMVKSGEILDLSKVYKPIVDKHSTGGVGDKVSLIVSPIVASCNIAVPKMSGRGLGKTGGTADKLDSIKGYKLKLSHKEFVQMLNEVGCAIISQSDDIAIADKKIYALRNEIGAVDSIPLIVSSIMSKKIASSSPNIVIDLKVGKGAFMKNVKSATKLSKKMKYIASAYDKTLICVLSDMENVLGKYVGNKLEVVECIDFFNGIYDKRLYKLCVYLSSIMVSIGKNISFRKAKGEVLLSLKNGKAKSKFYEWIKHQHGTVDSLKINARKYIVLSDKDGYINKIDADTIGKLSFMLGSGRVNKEDNIDYNVGVYINKSLGSKVRKNDVLGIIYYNNEIDGMSDIFKSAFVINKNRKRVHNIIIKTVK